MSQEKTGGSGVKSRKRSASLTQRLKEMRGSAGSSRSRGDSPLVSDSESDEHHMAAGRVTRGRERGVHVNNTNDNEVQLHELQERVRILETQIAMQQLQDLEPPITEVNAAGDGSGVYSLVSDSTIQKSETSVAPEPSCLRKCSFYCCWAW